VFCQALYQWYIGAHEIDRRWLYWIGREVWRGPGESGFENEGYISRLVGVGAYWVQFVALDIVYDYQLGGPVHL